MTMAMTMAMTTVNSGENLNFFTLDTANTAGLAHLLGAMPSPPILCIHFAGLKAVGEYSVQELGRVEWRGVAWSGVASPLADWLVG